MMISLPLLPALESASRMAGTGMLVGSLAGLAYRPSTGACRSATLSMGHRALGSGAALAAGASRPYQAVPALKSGKVSQDNQTYLPPQQKPVMASLRGST